MDVDIALDFVVRMVELLGIVVALLAPSAQIGRQLGMRART
jgi:hypothetical protein